MSDKITVKQLLWGRCPNCESEHLLGVTEDGVVVTQYGVLAEQTDDEEAPQFMYTYFSQPTEDRENESVQFDLFSDDEAGIRVQAILIAVHSMCKALPVLKGTTFSLSVGSGDKSQWKQ